jgi:hypothetical protein
MRNQRFIGGRTRKSPRLTVGGLIVLVIGVAAGVGLEVRLARIQRNAVLAITRPDGRASGQPYGEVRYDWEWPEPDLPSTVVRNSRPWAPKWMVDFFGIDHFGHVVCVRLRPGLRATDELMADVGRLKRLEELNIWHTDVDDAALAHVAGLTRLKRLCVESTRATSAGLVHLKCLKTLESLNLSDTEVGDAGIENLTGLRKLRELFMFRTFVTAAGLRELGRALPMLTDCYCSARSTAPTQPDPGIFPGDVEVGQSSN